MPRKSYLQIHVPLDTNVHWYQDLKSALSRIHVNWQNGGFHITAAFINDLLDETGAKKVAHLLDETLRNASESFVHFNTLDAFTAENGEQHIVYLSAPASFVSLEHVLLVKQIREKLKEQGYHLGPYKLHVTLARIPVSEISLQSLKEILGCVHFSFFATALNTASYCFQKGHMHPVRRWSFLSQGLYSSRMNKVSEYIHKRFMKDLDGVFKIQGRDGYRFVKLVSQDADFKSAIDEYFQGDLWTEYTFSGAVFCLFIAEQALLEAAGKDYLIDFLKVSRYPKFETPPELSKIGPDDILRISGLSAILNDKDIFTATIEPVQEVLYKEIDLKATVDDDIKHSVLQKYGELMVY